MTLRELVRADIVKELAMTGRVILGEEAARVGLVTRCVSDPLEEAMKVAKEICARSPDSVAATKQLFQRTRVCSEGEALKEETDIQVKLIASINQLVASSRNFTPFKVPYMNRKDDYVMTEDEQDKKQ